MDDRWESEITEYGAINITGFRIVDTDRRYVREFLDGWKRLDPITSIGAGKESITVRFACAFLQQYLFEWACDFCLFTTHCVCLLISFDLIRFNIS